MDNGSLTGVADLNATKIKYRFKVFTNAGPANKNF